MKKDAILNSLKQMRESSKERKFSQTVEYILSFKGIDFRKADKRIDVDVVLPHATGKQSAAKVLVFAKTPAFAEQLKGKADVMLENEISKLSKKKVGQIVGYDALFAEGPAMLTVAKHLGQQLAPKGKMPKPITPNMAQFDDVVSKLNVGVRVTNKKGKFMPLVQVVVGTEKHTDEQLAENILAVYSAIVPKLEKTRQNVKSNYVKLTMGPSIFIKDS